MYKLKTSRNWVKTHPKFKFNNKFVSNSNDLVTISFGIVVSHFYMARLVGRVKFVVLIQTLKNLREPRSRRDNLPYECRPLVSVGFCVLPNNMLMRGLTV